MPRSKNRPKQKKVPRKAPASRGPRKPKSKPNALSAYEAMIFDPCNSELLPGIYGSNQGLMSRHKQNWSMNDTADCGYIIWCPTYHCGGNGVKGGASGSKWNNCFVWTAGSADTRPAAADFGNNFTTPFSPVHTSTSGVADPAYSMVDGDMAMDARVISACLKATYLGEMQDNRGQICFLENLPMSSVYTGGLLTEPSTVNELFSLSPNNQRFGNDTYELVYRPDGTEDRFLTAEDGLACSATGGVEEKNGSVNSLNPHCFGIAWRGMGNVKASNISFEVIKNIEWRPEPISGMVSNTPTSNGPSAVNASVRAIDKKAGPSWTRRIAGTAQSIASTTADIAWGAKNAATTVSGIGNTFKNVMSIAGSAAPFLALL